MLIKYGVFEGYPARWNDREGWVCWEGTWKSLPPMEVMFYARVVDAAEYHELIRADDPAIK
jgi:hypothetical protein